MPYQTTLVYSEPLVRQAVLAFWRRSVGVSIVVALSILTASLAALLYQGDSTWIVGVLATVLCIGFLFIAAIYFVHYNNSMRKFRDMGSPQAMFTADEASF
jgi:general stress protein CsbA